MGKRLEKEEDEEDEEDEEEGPYLQLETRERRKDKHQQMPISCAPATRAGALSAKKKTRAGALTAIQ